MKKVKLLAIVSTKVLLSGILVFLVLRKIDVAEVASRVRSVGWFFPGAALMCFVVALFLAARRWQVLSGGLLTYLQALKYTWIGLFYSAILPGMVSGDVAKGASLALKNKHARVGELPLSIAMDRIVGLYSLIGFFAVSCAILAFGAGLLSPSLKRLGIYGFIAAASALLLGACVVGLVGTVLVRHETTRRPSNKIQAFFSQAFDTLQLYRRQPHLLLKALGYSVIIHCMCVVSFYLVIRGLRVDCNVMEVVVFYSMVSVLISLPVTISGVGLRDWFSLTFFQSVWGDGQAGVAFAWLALALGLIAALAGAIVQVTDLFAWRVIRRSSEHRPT
jgi:glycosyltransferase 2 family protein